MQKFVKVALTVALVLPQVSPLGMAIANANSLPTYRGTSPQCPAGTVFGWLHDTPTCFDLDTGGGPGEGNPGEGNPDGRDGGGGSGEPTWPSSPQDVQKRLDKEKKEKCEIATNKDLADSTKLFDTELRVCEQQAGGGHTFDFSLFTFNFSVPAFWIKNGIKDCLDSAVSSKKTRDALAGKSDPACN